MPEGTYPILTSGAHWKHPFEGEYQSIVNNQSKTATLSTRAKVAAFVISIFVGLFTAGVGGVLTFYLVTASFKNRKIRKLLSSEIKEFAHNTFGKKEIVMAPVPEQGIRVGLPNQTATTCWLNASLKFLALTPIFDRLFEIDPATLTRDLDKQVRIKNLQVYLYLTIEFLRKGKQKLFSQTLYNHLCQAIDALMPNFKVGARQEDAPNFISKLMGIFDFPQHRDFSLKKESPFTLYAAKFAHRYTPVDPEKTKRPNNNLEPQLILSLKPSSKDLSSKDPIDLSVLFSTPSDIPDLFLEESDERVPATEEKLLTHAPDTLTLLLDRIVQINGKQAKCLRDIAFNEDGTISFLLYDTKEDKCSTLTPITRVYYQPDYALRHIGSGTSSGHYTCVERPREGHPILHNDSSCTEIDEARFMKECKQAYILRLRKVRTTPFIPPKTVEEIEAPNPPKEETTQTA